MFESERPEVYEKVYEGLIPRLARAPLAASSRDLGLAWQEGRALAPLLGRSYLVGSGGVRAADGGETAITHRIVLAYYLLHQGSGETAGRFVPYRELPGGADFSRNLAQSVEARLARHFSGRADALLAAAGRLGAGPAPQDIQADAAFTVADLPKLPLMVTFYDTDEDFPAEAKLFYDLTAPNFLDLECLAVLGLILALELELADF